jgi:hypothetical protein
MINTLLEQRSSKKKERKEASSELFAKMKKKLDRKEETIT